MLTAAEEALVLRGFNDTAHRVPDDTTVIDLFESQVERTPDATAVTDRGRRCSYRELNEDANRLAWSLVAAGVGPGTIVGICLERSTAMVAAVLGVLKAGAAYLPLDPVNPDLRLHGLLADAGARIVITQSSLAPRVAVDGVRLLDLDAPDGWRSSHAPGNPGLAIHPESPIYVLYTSGSTGRPKGTVLPHRSMTNLIRWHLRTMTLGQRTLQLASLGFDASFHEFFATLGSGGSLVIVSEEVRRDPEALAELLIAERIEKAIVPVVVLSQLAERLVERSTAGCALTELTATGEQLVVTDARATVLRAAHPLRSLESLRPHRDARRHRLSPERAAGGLELASVDRPPDRQHARAPARCAAAAGADRRAGPPVPLGAEPGDLLSRSAGADGRAVPARPVRGGAGRADVRHRRPGPMGP